MMNKILIIIAINFCLLGNISQAGAAGLTVEQIKNSPFYIRGWEDETQGEWAQLQDGSYSRTNPDDQLFLKLHQIVFGHLATRPYQRCCRYLRVKLWWDRIF
jgi:hypothetical protein